MANWPSFDDPASTYAFMSWVDSKGIRSKHDAVEASNFVESPVGIPDKSPLAYHKRVDSKTLSPTSSSKVLTSPCSSTLKNSFEQANLTNLSLSQSPQSSPSPVQSIALPKTPLAVNSPNQLDVSPPCKPGVEHQLKLTSEQKRTLAKKKAIWEDDSADKENLVPMSATSRLGASLGLARAGSIAVSSDGSDQPLRVTVPKSSAENLSAGIAATSILAEAKLEHSIPAATHTEEESQRESADSEVGMNLTPVLSALGARSFTHADGCDDKPVVELSSKDQESEQSKTTAQCATNPFKIQSQISTHLVKTEPVVNPGIPFHAQIARVKLPEASSRTISLHGLPEDSDYTTIQSLIQGAVESIHLPTNSTAAQVSFVDPEDGVRFINAHPSGLRFRVGHVFYHAKVKMSTTQLVVSDKIQAYIDCGATRVIKVAHVDEAPALKELYTLAEGPHISRQIEIVLDSFRRGGRTIYFRFANISDAVAFRLVLLADPEWKEKDISFGDDPCQYAFAPREVRKMD